MNKGIVDRFEGNFAVIELETGKTEDILRKNVAPDVSSGDVVELRNGVWQANRLETEQRRDKIKALETELFED